MSISGNAPYHPSGTIEERKEHYLSALTEFAAGDIDKQSDLFISYHQLLRSVNETPDQIESVLAFVFSSLIEQLDKAPDGEIAEVLYLYTFRDFLEHYGKEAAVQAAIKACLDSGTLSKLPLIIALGQRRRG